jgi:demethoxyubiquinone hydroxylase (CLK1/Coq7/Cat5 family)
MAFNVEKAKERNYEKFRQNLKNREKRKVKEVLKSFKEDALKDVDKAIDSGMFDTSELYEENNYVFAKAVVKESAKHIAMPTTRGKEIEKQMRYV